MDNLKITITDDTNKYSAERAENKTEADVLGELNFGDTYCLNSDALENLCGSILALFPHDLVKLEITYSVGNH
jgi:hypothetical protein